MVSEKYTTLLRNVRDILGIKVFVAALFCSILFLIHLQSQNVLLHNIPRAFLNKFNGLSRNCVTDITLAKCHVHYMLCFWQLSGCNTTKLPHSCWKAVSMNCGCLFLSTVSSLVEACKQGMHSALALLSSKFIQTSGECIFSLILLMKNNRQVFCRVADIQQVSGLATNVHKETSFVFQ